MNDTKLRFVFNTNALVKTASILSNSILLTTNAYLIGTSLTNNIRQKKQEHMNDNLQTAAEIASAIAGLTKVISDTFGIHNAKGG